MPRIECRLVIELDHGSGVVLCAELEAFLIQHGYNVVESEHLGTTLTQDEVDEIRWSDESPNF